MNAEVEITGLTELPPSELVELEGLPDELVERDLPEVSLGELVPVEGATAEIILAYLPSCAKYGVCLNFWLDFRNTSSETISVRPSIDLVGYHKFSSFTPKELEPGQSYGEKYGHEWLAGLMAGFYADFGRVEAGIDVYTPEGWVEADKVVAPPFKWMYDFPLPELTIISAPEYAPAWSRVDIEVEYYNPGFLPPGGSLIINGEWFGYYRFPPAQATPFTIRTYTRDQDTTITFTPQRQHPPGAWAYGQPDIAGEPVSVTVRVATVPMYQLDVVINGEGIVLPEDASGNYLEGTVIELTAYGAPGWWFHSWEGTDNDAVNPTTVTMDRDRHVVANFTQEARAGCLPIVAAGVLLVAGIIASIILLV
ncbi:hypothetical protein ES708_30227 [subsurface metagenome]